MHSMAPNHSTLPPLPCVSKVMTGLAASKQPVPLVPAAVRETMTVQKSNDVKNSLQLLRLPPISGGKADRRNNGATTAAVPAEAAERAARARMREALARRVAWRMLKRGTPSASSSPHLADEGSRSSLNVLACCCARLPPGLRCALHQAAAPGRSWMRMQRSGSGNGDGAACEAVAVAVVLPRACGRGGGGWAFSEYARWRRHVWLPTRFYLERVEKH